jgi:hypothetical protein
MEHEQQGILRFPVAHPAGSASDLPRWDRVRRELRLGGELVKAYTGPAANQEVILEAFEELGWTKDIDNPLPREKDEDPHKKLEQTVRRLNGHQRAPLLRFHVCGGGHKVRWERLLEQPGPDEAPGAADPAPKGAAGE